MITPARHKPFAMIREFHLADWFSLANAVCGTGALFSMMSYLQSNRVMHVYLACGLVLAALVFDVLDGRIARWRQQASVMGRELDSLADVISFGVAPALIAFGCGMQGFFDRIILAYFVACGVSRLARYNITAEALSPVPTGCFADPVSGCSRGGPLASSLVGSRRASPRATPTRPGCPGI